MGTLKSKSDIVLFTLGSGHDQIIESDTSKTAVNETVLRVCAEAKDKKDNEPLNKTGHVIGNKKQKVLSTQG